MFASKSVSALVIVIFCSAHSCLNGQDVDPNSSLLEASKIHDNGPAQPFHQQHLDSVEKSDHNFYLPINDNSTASTITTAFRTKDATTTNVSSASYNNPSRLLSKKSATCSSAFVALISPPPPTLQCSLVEKTPSSTLPATNTTATASIQSFTTNSTENCERQPVSIFQSNDTKVAESAITEKDQINISSQNEDGNKSIRSGESTVDDIIRMKSSPVSAKDMLSFEEWRKKISEQMDSANVQKQHDLIAQQEMHSLSEANAVKSPAKVQTLPTNRARNFASYECGAKIVDSNSEADFVNRVLNEQTDEYMLNPCKTKNWFVIELCETIQPQYLELANFELYSSIPKEFSVFASEHYPARTEWSVLGAFTSSDVRTVQGFKLHNNGFVKYLKIELNSYYGAEHFCPISVIRVFGTSLFDEVERIDKPEPIDFTNRDENSLFEDSMQAAVEGPDIFGSAKKAVYNIFMKALNFNVFNRILDNFSLNKDSKVSYNIHEQSQAIKLYSSFEVFLAQCESFFISSNYSTMNIPSKCIFLRSFFPDQLFELFYTQYFIRQYISPHLLFQCPINNTELNLTSLGLLISNSMQTINLQMNHRNSNKLISSNLSDTLADPQSHISLMDQINTSLSSSIIPTTSHSQTSFNFTLESSQIQPTVIQSVINTLPLPAVTVSASDGIPLTPIQKNTNTNSSSGGSGSTGAPVVQPPEMKSDQSAPAINVHVPAAAPVVEPYESDVQALSSNSGQSKEAVIIRLTNRIKNLEKNISLMSTYLENLSVRYRIQMEEMQLIFNKTIDHLNNTAIRATEKDAKQQENIMALESEINRLKEKMEIDSKAQSDNWLYIEIHVLLMLLELSFVAALCLIFYLVFRRMLPSLPKNNVPSNETDCKQSPEERQLIAQLGTQIKKSLYRSKSLSDLREEHFLLLQSGSYPIGNGLSSGAKSIDNTDCDNPDNYKENCPQSYSNSNCTQTNIGDQLTVINGIESSAKRILKAVNN